ncbi:hypothetical protein P3L10_010915 [Capsicum annuum]
MYHQLHSSDSLEACQKDYTGTDISKELAVVLRGHKHRVTSRDGISGRYKPSISTSVVAERLVNALAGIGRLANTKPSRKKPYSATTTAKRPRNDTLIGGVRPETASITEIKPAAVVMSATTSAVCDNATKPTTQQSIMCWCPKEEN